MGAPAVVGPFQLVPRGYRDDSSRSYQPGGFGQRGSTFDGDSLVGLVDEHGGEEGKDLG